jgi:hypothetical protein
MGWFSKEKSEPTKRPSEPPKAIQNREKLFESIRVMAQVAQQQREREQAMATAMRPRSVIGYPSNESDGYYDSPLRIGDHYPQQTYFRTGDGRVMSFDQLINIVEEVTHLRNEVATLKERLDSMEYYNE